MMGGKRVPPYLQRLRSDDLMASVFPAQTGCQDNAHGPVVIPDHPLVVEAMNDCLEDACDLSGLITLLEGIESGAIECLSRETPEPSPFSHAILNANPYAFLDDAPLEERRARAVSVRRSLPSRLEGELGVLSPDAIAQVIEDAAPAPRDADEVHDLLLTLGVLPAAEATAWGPWLEELVAAKRTARLAVSRGPEGRFTGWVAAERIGLARLAYPGHALVPPIEAPARAVNRETTREAALVTLVGARMETCGPVTAPALAAALGLPDGDVEIALAQLEADGRVMRGQFLGRAGDPLEWCERRLLARIHHTTLGRLRREIAPVTTAEYIRFLLRWQHLAPGTQLHGEAGTRAVIAQLQGFELAAAGWEADVLAARLGRYDDRWLDALCMSGEVVWGRFSPRATTGSPTRSAPIGLALRADLAWLLADTPEGEPTEAALSHPARDVLDYLERRGASFFADLVSGVRRLPSELEDALWELVAAGRITGDGMAGLRALVAPRPDQKHASAGGRRLRRAIPRRAQELRRGTGRWSLLRVEGKPVAEALETRAKQLLGRWGVMLREILTREPNPPAWRDLLQIYRRLESRGELRGGRFVEGFPGEQFALPEALDAMRAVRRTDGTHEEVWVSAVDPLNVVGILTPGPRVPASVGTEILYRAGVPVEARRGVQRTLIAKRSGPGEAVTLRDAV
jgi:ATP-dependent Lhr-like helicase